MSLSEYIIASYGASIYRKTLKLKETKKTMAKSKKKIPQHSTEILRDSSSLKKQQCKQNHQKMSN